MTTNINSLIKKLESLSLLPIGGPFIEEEYKNPPLVCTIELYPAYTDDSEEYVKGMCLFVLLCEDHFLNQHDNDHMVLCDIPDFLYMDQEMQDPKKYYDYLMGTIERFGKKTITKIGQ